MIRFARSIFTRFAKTFGCLFLVAGFALAVFFYNQQQPAVEAARYRPSSLLSERLSNLTSQYKTAKGLVLRFKGKTEFPEQYAAVKCEPQFSRSYIESKDFAVLRSDLSQLGNGRDAMKRSVTDAFEALLSDIRRKPLDHAQALRASSDPAPASPTPNPPSLSDSRTLYDGVDSSGFASRKSSLDSAREYLATLGSAAQNPENKKKIEDSISEIEALARLLPGLDAASPAVPAVADAGPLNAEKVAARLDQMRNSIRRAILSQWALDEAFGRALQTAEEEQGRSLRAEANVKQVAEQMHLLMAAAITGGIAIGMLFLLIGDWTSKSSTLVLLRPWRELIEGCSASPKEVYDLIEKAVKAREIPGLESTREFWHEGGALSAKREYLRLARERLVFDICAAPFGTGFFLSFRVSFMPFVIDPLGIFAVLGITGAALLLLANSFGLLWGAIILVFALCVLVFSLRTAIARGLGDLDRVLMKTPLFGPLYELFLRPVTYYRIDSTAMYLRAVHQAVSESFEAMFGDRGIPLMPHFVAKPVLEELYRR